MTILKGRSGTKGDPRELEVSTSGAEATLRFRNPGGKWTSTISVPIVELLGALDALPAESQLSGRTPRSEKTLEVSPRDHADGKRNNVWPPEVYLWRMGTGGWDIVVSVGELRAQLP